MIDINSISASDIDLTLGPPKGDLIHHQNTTKKYWRKIKITKHHKDLQNPITVKTGFKHEIDLEKMTSSNNNRLAPWRHKELQIDKEIRRNTRDKMDDNWCAKRMYLNVKCLPVNDHCTYSIIFEQLIKIVHFTTASASAASV